MRWPPFRTVWSATSTRYKRRSLALEISFFLVIETLIAVAPVYFDMARTTSLDKIPRLSREPDNPRTSMEPSDMEPDDARQFMHDLVRYIHNRMDHLPNDGFIIPEDTLVTSQEKAKQHYGNDTYQLLAGIKAALREWDESGRDVKELKERYGGKFVEGVEIGERLAVYQGSDFDFSMGEGDDKTNFAFVK